MQNKERKNHLFRGFSFVEILMSLGLMSLVLSTFGYMGVQQFEAAKQRLAQTNAFMIANKIIEHSFLHQRYPDNLAQVEGIPQQDPWGNPFQYRRPGKINRNLLETGYDFDVFAQVVKNGTTIKEVGNWNEDAITNGRYLSELNNGTLPRFAPHALYPLSNLNSASQQEQGVENRDKSNSINNGKNRYGRYQKERIQRLYRKYYNINENRKEIDAGID
ncbi:MAG: hypothetical protein AAF310_01700 [Myxococcota bacterium]